MMVRWCSLFFVVVGIIIINNGAVLPLIRFEKGGWA